MQDMVALAHEATGLEERAKVVAERNENSPMFHALLNHRDVASPCGMLSISLPRPGSLSQLHGRLRIRSPADGLFDPSMLGSVDARDQLLVELRRPSPEDHARFEKHTLRLWVFLAHLVTADDMLVADTSEGEEPEANAQASNTNTNGGSKAAASLEKTGAMQKPEISLDGVWDDGSWTGTLVWDAAILATAYMLRSADWRARITNSSCVLELGAGLGLPALVCAFVLGAHRVVATDRAPQVLDLLLQNAWRVAHGACNAQAEHGGDPEALPNFAVESLDWSAEAARELPARLGVSCIDTVICCDCILARLFGAVEALAEFLGALASAHSGLRVLIASELRPGCGVGAFLARAAEDFVVSRLEVVGLVHLYELRARASHAIEACVL